MFEFEVNGERSGIKFYALTDYNSKIDYLDVPSYVQESRQLLYDFKDGIRYKEVVDMLYDAIINEWDSQQFDSLMIIPASTENKNRNRFQKFCELLSDKLQIENGYQSIRRVEDRETIKQGDDYNLNRLFGLAFEKGSIENKTILLFDDIITSGQSAREVKMKLEELGAKEVVCIFLVATYDTQKNGEPKWESEEISVPLKPKIKELMINRPPKNVDLQSKPTVTRKPKISLNESFTSLTEPNKNEVNVIQVQEPNTSKINSSSLTNQESQKSDRGKNWGLIIGLIFFSLLICLIFYVDSNKHEVQSESLKEVEFRTLLKSVLNLDITDPLNPTLRDELWKMFNNGDSDEKIFHFYTRKERNLSDKKLKAMLNIDSYIILTPELSGRLKELYYSGATTKNLKSYYNLKDYYYLNNSTAPITDNDVSNFLDIPSLNNLAYWIRDSLKSKYQEGLSFESLNSYFDQLISTQSLSVIELNNLLAINYANSLDDNLRDYIEFLYFRGESISTIKEEFLSKSTRKKTINEAKARSKNSANFISFAAKLIKEGKLRDDASPLANVIAAIPKNTRVNVINIDGDYWLVTYKGRTGYINKFYLERLDDSKEIADEKYSTNNIYESRTLIKRGVLLEYAFEDSPILVRIREGQVVKVVSKSGIYYRVEYENSVGYLNEKYLENLNNSKVATEELNSSNYSGESRTLIKRGVLLEYAFEDSPILVRIRKGQVVKVVSKSGMYYRVEYENSVGYLNEKFLNK